MTDLKNPVVCVDVMGGDRAPAVVIAGIDQAMLVYSDVRVLAVGDRAAVEPLSVRHERVDSVFTTQVIGMDEHPAAAVRSKKDSSITVGCRLVSEGKADAFFSAGNTGAAMAAATLLIGRLPGVSRPAIAAVIPTLGPPVVLLDVGANADCRPEYLLHFAHMGAAYARVVLGVHSPRVALLNIGAEETKGSTLTLEAHALMAQGVPGFIGNVEGYDITRGVADVIVTDGFTGNVALKLMEGISATLMGQIRTVMTSSLLAKLGATPLKPGLKAMKDGLDAEVYGGAPLLGIDGVCIIGHGGSTATAVCNAIGVAADAVRGGLTSATAEALRVE